MNLLDLLGPPAAVVYTIEAGRHVPAIIALAPLEHYTDAERQLSADVWHGTGRQVLVLAAPHR